MRYPIPARTQDYQKRASDPQVSAWVSAHAGSGKTHVLTQRVVRLLLAGVAPSRLICLTFTKVAAANMSARVFGMLAGWTLDDDESLRAKIRATGAEPPEDLNVARKLFAAAVDPVIDHMVDAERVPQTFDDVLKRVKRGGGIQIRQHLIEVEIDLHSSARLPLRSGTRSRPPRPARCHPAARQARPDRLPRQMT